MLHSALHPVDLPLVAIGASAGGLEPLERFFENVPEHPGIAYVVIQHLSPDYRSMMNELLARKSKLRIVHIEDGMKLAPDTVYLIRPEMFATLQGDTFRTEAYKEGDGLPHLPIDHFFASLRQRDPARTVAVVLSGSGSDGALGAELLHQGGAAVIAQTPQEAGFASMPRAVLVSGYVDNVSSVRDMPRLIEDILRDGKASVAPDARGAESIMVRILKRIEARHKVDFQGYKRASVHRRVMRRLHLRGLPSLESYERLLGQDPAALDELFEDMLIGVTEFYRDPHAVGQLRQHVLDLLAQEGDATAPPIKIWVPACSSGEEVYTIAIELSEALRAAQSARGFRVIGTDVHAKAIEQASRGVYTAEQLAALPEALKDRYFDKIGQGYMIDPVLRQKIIFSHHNLISDPPFMSLDLVSCRNLLIYLEDEAQASAISMFLFGLKPGGALFLGASESVGKFSAAFDVIAPRWRLFRKSEMSKQDVSALLSKRENLVSFANEAGMQGTGEAAMRRAAMQHAGSGGQGGAPMPDMRARDGIIRAYDALLKRYAPAAILITGDSKVITWFGSAGQWIDTMSNLAEWTVQDIVHPDLHFVISVGVEKLRQGQAARHERLVTLNGAVREARVTLETLVQSATAPVIIVTITPEGVVAEAEPVEGSAPMPTPVADAGAEGSEDVAILSRRIQELERDLRLTEETLQHATERLEASSEELQASNEELQASNEELQASNEELQSSNEELHAVNEELVSVSGEHERKIELLQELDASSETVLRMLNTGVIVLDAARRIRRYSQLIRRDFLLQEHDLGRALATVGPRLEFADLDAMADGLDTDPTPQTRDGTHEGRALSIEARRLPERAAPGAEGAGYVFLFRWV